MDRIISPYPRDDHRGLAPDAAGHAIDRPAAEPSRFRLAPNPTKAAGDYVHALKRRAWLVGLVALTIGVPLAILVLRLPPVYLATAQIEVTPPRFDPSLAALISPGGGSRLVQDTYEHYVTNKGIILRGQALAAKVAEDPSFPDQAAAVTDLGKLLVRQLPASNIYTLSLESTDPSRVAKLLNALVREFQQQTEAEGDNQIGATIRTAEMHLRQMEVGDATADPRSSLKGMTEELDRLVQRNPIFGPNGRNLLDQEYEVKTAALGHRRLRLDDTITEARMAQYLPKAANAPAHPKQGALDRLEADRERAADLLDVGERAARNPNDAGIAHYRQKMADIDKKIAKLKSGAPGTTTRDLSGIVVDQSRQDVRKAEEEVKVLLAQMQQVMPVYQSYLSLVRDREKKAQTVADMQSKLREFRLLKESQVKPVKSLQEAVEQMEPAKPNRQLLLVGVAILGLGAGIGLAFLLELVDHRVKVPEHLADGLRLPLLAVIPRIARLAENHRGGHLWTSSTPHAPAADAFRNLRASLLGHDGPLVTLLITSAKAGEGKSTTALNLAATCARAGERTLLLDVDLRRGSLGPVFEPHDHEFGLADVLRGDMPWQRAVLHTDVPNLDFLPLGDAADLPIEILGSRELKQLVAGLSGHYDRVILDGPAVLGLADCRMLGRVVDATLLVVRSGVHELKPLERAKSMLEQSKVRVAGVALNALADDLENWACPAHAAIEPGRRSTRELTGASLG